jgi:hypothetical protein
MLKAENGNLFVNDDYAVAGARPAISFPDFSFSLCSLCDLCAFAVNKV